MGKRKLRRRWVLLAGVILLALIGAVSGDAEDEPAERAAALGTAAPRSTPAPQSTPTPDPGAEARALARRGRYDAAIAAYEAAGLDDEADRVRRRGARALNRSARRALTRGRHTTAKRLATRSRRLHRTAAARAIIASADAQAAAARERARIARDRRTCSAAEKRTVREGGGTPPGCAGYVPPQPEEEACDPNYSGACLKPGSPDYDCAGGSGDGPDYTGPVQVVGSDPHDLDRDGDGAACETS
jgi:hypothetical protein